MESESEPNSVHEPGKIQVNSQQRKLLQKHRGLGGEAWQIEMGIWVKREAETLLGTAGHSYVGCALPQSRSVNNSKYSWGHPFQSKLTCSPAFDSHHRLPQPEALTNEFLSLGDWAQRSEARHSSSTRTTPLHPASAWTSASTTANTHLHWRGQTQSLSSEPERRPRPEPATSIRLPPCPPGGVTDPARRNAGQRQT